jgi:hypothetical protein
MLANGETQREFVTSHSGDFQVRQPIKTYDAAGHREVLHSRIHLAVRHKFQRLLRRIG